jgi:plasmid stability protein
MSKRTSILLPDDIYEHLRRRARQRSTTVSDEIREVLQRDCADENPNQWLLDLAEALKDVEWKPGPSAGDPGFKSWLREGIADRVQRKLSGPHDDPGR